MLQQPQLTVIMPVYNMQEYLGRALEALTQQEDRDFKLLIVNDGSTDRTRAIAQSYQDRFPFFRIINKPNGGLSDARNVGMANVDTPYFTFHDGDDWAAPGYTAFFTRAFAAHPQVAMVSCGFWIDSPDQKVSRQIGHKGARMLTKREAYLKLTNVFGSPIKGYTWNKGYRTAVVRKYHLKFVKDLTFMEDQIFNVNYVSLTDGFYYSSHPYYHYWQRSDSMVHAFNLKMVPDNFRANYRVWHRIVVSLAQEQDSHKAAKKGQKIKTIFSDDHQ